MYRGTDYLGVDIHGPACFGHRWIGSRNRVAIMPRRSSESGRSERSSGLGGLGGSSGLARSSGLGGFGRYSGPATLILSSLAAGPKHGYALTKDIETFAGVHLAPGTLYEALARLEGQGLIEALEAEERRRPYQLTAAGAAVLRDHLSAQRRVADIGLRRLSRKWSAT